MAEAYDGKVPKLSWFLDHDEFLLVWAFLWVSYNWKSYGMGDYPEEASKEIFENVGAGMRWSIAKLCCEYGFEFNGLSVNEVGEVQLKSMKPIEPRNEFQLYRLLSGKMPNPKNALEVSIRMLTERRISIDLEPFRAALEDVKKSFEEARKQIDPETDRLMGRGIAAAMRHAGYVRPDDEETN